MQRDSIIPRGGAARAGALLAALAVVATGLGGTPARAQGDDSATVKLIQILIAKGILTKDQAASLLTQAQGEAHARPAAHPTASRAGAAALVTAEPPPAPEVPKGTVRVTYVPQSVRDQIAQQVRDEVLGEEQKNGWAAPNALPEWTKRITVYGDLRLRGERDLQDPGNKEGAGSGSFPFFDFNGANQAASPFDLLGTAPYPAINSTENRTRYRFRARLGFKADVDDWISTDIRLASGNDNNPVSENQTLGQNGNFGKYSIWLDRAYALLKVPPRAKLNMLSTLQAYIGRFGNPFWTTDLVYSDDINFDGAAVQAVAPVAPNLSLWLTGGAFEVYNTDFNYQNGLTYTKFASRDKYLFAAQAGVDYKPAPAIVTKLAVGMFNYQNVQGQGGPCTILYITDTCESDNSRPQFAQFGNTYFPLRNGGNPAFNPLTGTTNTFNPQYFGLASRFNVLDLHGRVQFTRYDPVDVEIEAEYSKNLAFNRKDIINKGPLNNFGNVPEGAPQGPYAGGDTAWMVKLEVGKPEITKRNEWNAYFGYKHLDSDSVLDAFTDSNFHLGGTNAKGFFTGVDYGLGKNTYLAARWLSADEVEGPKYRNDVVQIDLNTKF